MNPYLQCSKQCAFLHAINNVCESILAVRFQFFCLFCLILEKKVMVPNESKLAEAIFIYEQLLIAILPLQGEKKREEDPEESNKCFWLHDTMKQKFEHGAYHNLI